MDMPLPSPSRFHRVLTDMSRSIPLLDLFYLSALAETLALLDRENAAEPRVTTYLSTPLLASCGRGEISRRCLGGRVRARAVRWSAGLRGELRRW
jgi:hypothetical protein